MSLGEMSLSGAVMIFVVVVIRALTINRLPKKTFLALWGVVLVRLLVPYSLPSVFSVYSLVGRLSPRAEAPAALPAAQAMPAAPAMGVAVTPSLPAASSVPTKSVDLWMVVWLVGMAACAAFFAVAYWRCRREFRESLPVKNGFVKSWIGSCRLRRTIEIRQTDRLSAPLTYGVLRPVILLPKRIDWEDETALAYVLAHEYVHIRRFDTVTKLVLTITVCVHWFNPAVWILYALANRDIELSCDEAVVRLFGEHAKSAYALTLIRMEETRSGLTPLCNNFSKHAIEERIVAIMKIKKTSWMAMLAALALVAGVTTAFATTGQTAAANGTENADRAVAPNGSQLDDLEETTTELTTIISYVDRYDGKTYYSTDGGSTWLEGDALEALGYDLEETEWWTAEEYEQWMEEQKQAYQSIIGERSWNPTEGWYTWDQARVDEAVAGMEQLLEEIKDGKMVSKPTQDGDTMLQYSYDPGGIETATETGESYSSADNADQELSPERLAEYEPFGLSCDKSAGTLYWNGRLVRYFTDSVDIDGNSSTAYQYWNGEGTVDIHTVRQATKNADGSYDPFGRLTGIEEYKAGELDTNGGLFSALLESVAQGDTALESADQSGQSVSVAAGDYAAAESGDTGTEFMAEMAKYAPFGVTFVKSGSFGNLYWNGELVDILIDHSPDGRYMTVSSTKEGGITLQTVYDSNGKLSGVEEMLPEAIAADEQARQYVRNGYAAEFERTKEQLAPYLAFGLDCQMDFDTGRLTMTWEGKPVHSFFDARRSLFVANSLGDGGLGEDAVDLEAVYDQGGTLVGVREI